MSIWVSPVGNVGAWVETITPVRAAARPEARNERSSRAVIQGRSEATSPMKPARTPVPGISSTRSAIRYSAS
jgi:hypothetical protein